MSVRNKKYIDYLKQRFNESNYTNFVTDLLNLSSEDLNKNAVNVSPAQNQFKDTIEFYKYIANYTSGTDNIGIFIVKLSKKGSQNARSYQRTFISSLLNTYDLDASIVAFYQDDEPTWRLSFVKKELYFTDKGIKVDITPARRYSYLVGENEAVHTAQEYLFKLLEIEDRKITLSDIEKVFDVEKVTKEFFEEYKEKYLKLKEYLDENEDFVTESINHDFTSEEFAKKLMGQIVFLYFLQKKGWLGVQIVPFKISIGEYNELVSSNDSVSNNLLQKYYLKKDTFYQINKEALREEKIKENIDNFVEIFKYSKYDKPWGTGDKQFVRNMFVNSKLDHKDNFFDEYLEPFFYTGLNEKRNNQYFPLFNCKIPFLNGGLFEPLNNYRWSSAQFNIPDSFFSNNEGNGILDIFDLYNFTIDEEEPLEKDIAVDPEMLGKIFENLLDVKDRKSTGSFYTPREIVHYMCQESLANYIVNKLKIPYEDIISFIKYGDIITQTDWTNIYNGNEDHLLPNSVWNRLLDIDKALIEVKVADPAVGSGAFPLGMLNEIVKLRDNISSYILIQEDNGVISRSDLFPEQLNRDLHSLKLQTIQNSIYAVDSEISAIDIAKLRLWLSLIVDFPNDQEPRPLPNLDCKIMQGNSLLDEYEGVPLFSERELSNNLKNYKRNMSNGTVVRDIVVQQTLSFDDEKPIDYYDLLSIMLDLQKQYFITSDNKAKKELKDKIENIQITMVQKSLYNNSKKLNKFNEIAKKKSKPWFIWRLEFFEVFKNNNGFDIVISNPPYVQIKSIPEADKNAYKKKYVFAIGRFNLFYLFMELATKILCEGGVTNYIIPDRILLNTQCNEIRSWLINNQVINEIVSFDEEVFDSAVVDTIIFRYTNIKNKEKFGINIKNNTSLQDLFSKKSKYLKYDYISNTETHQIDINFSENDYEIRGKILSKSVNLGSISETKDGIIQSKIPDVLFLKQNINAFCKPLLFGKNINRYTQYFDSDYVNYNIDEMKKIEASRNGGGLRMRTPEIFERNKILTRQTADEIIATYDINKMYYSNTLHGTTITDHKYDPYYVTGILNSKLETWYYRNNVAEKGKVFAQIKIELLRTLPILDIDPVEQSEISNLVKEIYSDYSKIETNMKIIDMIIYRKYNLSDEEIKMIEDSFLQ